MSEPQERPAAEPPGRGPARRLVRPVVMIGLMGAGKSSVGARLADLLGAHFADSDKEIERAANLTIPEIFDRYGEPYFRDGERRVIARLLAGRPQVLAIGGGAFMDAETRAVIPERGVSVWIKADLETLIQRTAGRTHRPLLNTGDPRQTLNRLIAARYKTYALADVTVESRLGLSHVQMAGRIIAALEDHARRTGRGAVETEDG